MENILSTSRQLLSRPFQGFYRDIFLNKIINQPCGLNEKKIIKFSPKKKKRKKMLNNLFRHKNKN